MKFHSHPEVQDFQLDTAYRGALFAWPVLLNANRISTRNWSLQELGIDELGSCLSKNQFMSNEAQRLTFLSSAVDASFVSNARSQEVSVLRMLVSLQNQLPSVQIATDLFRINEFDVAGGGLVFIVGVIFRKASDPRPLSLPDPDQFLVSQERLEMEVALSKGEEHYRHQILPAFPLSRAVAEGLRMGVQCWSGMYEEPMRCDFDLDHEGNFTFALSVDAEDEAGDEAKPMDFAAEDAADAKAIYLRFGHDVVSQQDMNSIQEAFVRCASNSHLNQSAYKH
jgi:hypothetical protein